MQKYGIRINVAIHSDELGLRLRCRPCVDATQPVSQGTHYNADVIYFLPKLGMNKSARALRNPELGLHRFGLRPTGPLNIVLSIHLLVPEFTVTHLLPYLLTITLCGQWEVQWSEPEYWLCFSVGYYSTWLWIRLSIQSCGAIPQDLCRSLIFSLPIGGEIMLQLFFESL